MVLNLFVKTLDLVKVQPKRVRETNTTEIPSIPKPDIEDALDQAKIFSVAEDMEDQTRMTLALKLTSNAGENHGYQDGARLVLNSESPLMDGSTEKQETTYGDH